MPRLSPLPPARAGASLARRQCVAAAATLPWWGRVRAQSAPLRIGQSVALSGPLAELGTAMHQGAQAAFAAANAQGGVHGRTIELVAADDGYEVPRALANLERFLADAELFALFNCMGTPMVEAMLPKVRASQIPFFAPFTGALLSRVTGARNIFNIRASYAEEVARLVQHLSAVGVARIAVVSQNNAFGKEVLHAAQESMQALKRTLAATATVENNASDAAAAAQQLDEANPDVVLIGLAGKPTLEFIKAFRALRRGTALYATSVMGTAATVQALGPLARGLTISQVVPLPANPVLGVTRSFRQAWKDAGHTHEPSHLALEGYINARVFIEALQRAGRNPTRAAFIDATWGLKNLDLGGFLVHASAPQHSASRFVELTMVNHEGRFIR